jgi:hypothetical protein
MLRDGFRPSPSEKILRSEINRNILSPCNLFARLFTSGMLFVLNSIRLPRIPTTQKTIT